MNICSQTSIQPGAQTNKFKTLLTVPGHDQETLQALPLATQLRFLGQVPGARLTITEPTGPKHLILHPSQLKITDLEWELDSQAEAFVLVGHSKRFNQPFRLQTLGYFDLSPSERIQWQNHTVQATYALLNSQRP